MHLFKNPHIICSNHCKECLSTWKWFVRSCLYNSSLSHRAPFRWKWNQTLGFMGTVQQLSSCLVLWLLGCFHILLYFGDNHFEGKKGVRKASEILIHAQHWPQPSSATTHVRMCLTPPSCLPLCMQIMQSSGVQLWEWYE